MTEQPEIPDRPVTVTAPEGSRLEQLHAAYEDAKAAKDEAETRLKAVVDAIKVEATQAAPGAERIEIVGDHGPRLSLTYVESWRVDSRRLKAEDPETYVRYATKSGTWKLEKSKGQR